MRAAGVPTIVVLQFLATGLALASQPLSDAECAELLQKLDRQSTEIREEVQGGTMEKARTLHDRCLAPGIDAKVAARAGLLVVAYGKTIESDQEGLDLLGPLEARLRNEVPSPELLDVLRAVAGRLELLDRFEESDRYLREALELRKQLVGSKSPEVASDLSILGDLHAHWAEKAEPAKHRQRAIAYGEEGVALMWAKGGADDPETRKRLSALESILKRVGVERVAAEKVLRKYGWTPEESEE